MNSDYKNNLFLDSGCLTARALQDYYADQLSREDAGLVEKHLMSCEFCAEALEGMLFMDDDNAFIKDVELLNSQIQSKSTFKTRSFPLWGVVSSAASIIIIVGFVFLFQNNNNKEKTQFATVTDSLSTAVNIQKEEKMDHPGEKGGKKGIVETDSGKRQKANLEDPKKEVEKEISENVVRGTDSTILHIDGVNAVPIGGVMEREQEQVPEVPGLQMSVQKRTETVMEKTLSAATPQFPGGHEAMLQFLSDSLQYPEKAIQNAISGEIEVGFLVNKDGSLSHIKVIKGMGYGCDEEAIRLVSIMPRWQPVIQGNDTLALAHRISIPFILPVK